jgi:hypothetical protein
VFAACDSALGKGGKENDVNHTLKEVEYKAIS